MASADDVKKLASLARLSISDEALPKLAKEFESILAYISQINTLQVSPDSKKLSGIRNVMREDGQPHETGKYTQKLVAQFPERDGDYLKVKQIISHD